jgi:CDGSH-type Zn-finger protein
MSDATSDVTGNGNDTGNSVQIFTNGPMAVRGTLTLKGAPLEESEVYLCRCGRSNNKPYCDDSHLAAGVALAGECSVREPPPPPAVADGDALDVEPRPNGPIRLTGNFVLMHDSGAVAERLAQVALCRCGLTKKPPFCDSSHRAAGFVAP